MWSIRSAPSSPPSRSRVKPAVSAAGGGVEALRARHVARRGERHATHQRHARVVRQHLGGQQSVDRAKRLQALLEPQPEPARALREPAKQRRIARLGRMAQRLNRPSAPRERTGDAAMYGPIPVRVLLEPALPAVVPDERMQPHRRIATARGRQQTGECFHRHDPQFRVTRAGHLVNEPRLDRVEQSHVEHELAVLGRDVAPQPRLDPVRDRAVGAPGARLPAPPGVAIDAKRKRPARGILDHRRQLPPRQPLIEELRDLRIREPQLAGRHRRLPPFEREPGNLQPRRLIPERHPDMEVVRSAVQQHVDRGGGLRAAQTLQLVQRQHARRAVARDRTEQQLDPIGGLTVRLRVRRRRRAAPLAGWTEGREPGLLEGVREMSRQRPRPVFLVQRKPRDRDALLAQRPAAPGEQGGLAEPSRGVQHRQAAIQERAAFLQLRALDVALDGVRQPYLVP